MGDNIVGDRVRELATRTGLSADVVNQIYGVAFADAKAGAITGIKPRAKDLRLSRALYDDAYSHGMSMSAWLEHLDPSREYGDGLDAFERQLKIADIKTQSIAWKGLWADKVERLFASDKPGTEWLFPEFIARKWRAVGRPRVAGERFYASSSPVSDVLYPDYISSQIRQKQIAAAIPLGAIVAITTPIDSGVYEAFYLTDDETERQMVRVGEGAEVPTVKLTGGDHTIRMKKYGRRILGTYETFRRMRIDRFALHLQLLAIQAEVDKVNTGIDVLINGDGNSGTAATNHNLTTLDTGAVAGTLSLKGYLAWRQQWANPYICDVVLAREADALSLLLLNLGSSNVPFFQLAGAFGIGGVTPINSGLGPAQLGWSSQVTASHLLGIDSRFALEMVTEIGASLTETDKIIGKQFNEIVMTESVGFCIFDANANKTMDIST